MRIITAIQTLQSGQAFVFIITELQILQDGQALADTDLAGLTSVLPVYQPTLQDEQTFCVHIYRLNQVLCI